MSDQPQTGPRRYHPVSQPPPQSTQQLHRARFTYADAKAQKVGLAGEFNNWSPDANPMVRHADGVWTLQIELPAGTHQYLFSVDGKWVLDPKAMLSHHNSHGGTNSVILV
ncbi:MAG: isoamylase early set domain-containing protein [Verrucomicrobiia bacterium]